MSRKAVDVVLLPPENVMEEVIQLNEKFGGDASDNFKLGKHDYIPHISLCMAIIEDEDYSEVERILEKIQEDFSPLELQFDRVNSKEIEGGSIFSAIVLKDPDKLQELHENVVEKFKPYMGSKPSENMFYGSEEILETTLNWVRDFKEESSYENFLPHISVGFGNLDLDQKTKFEASKIAICHLGKFCTCRDILMAAEL